MLQVGWSKLRSRKQQKWGEHEKYGCVPARKWSNTVAALQCPAPKPISPSVSLLNARGADKKIAWKVINRSFRSHCLPHQHVKPVVCYLCPTYERFMLGWRISPLSKLLWSSFLPHWAALKYTGRKFPAHDPEFQGETMLKTLFFLLLWGNTFKSEHKFKVKVRRGCGPDKSAQGQLLSRWQKTGQDSPGSHAGTWTLD